MQLLLLDQPSLARCEPQNAWLKSVEATFYEDIWGCVKTIQNLLLGDE